MLVRLHTRWLIHLDKDNGHLPAMARHISRAMALSWQLLTQARQRQLTAHDGFTGWSEPKLWRAALGWIWRTEVSRLAALVGSKFGELTTSKDSGHDLDQHHLVFLPFADSVNAKGESLCVR